MSKVLIADDDKLVRTMLAYVLAKVGLDTVSSEHDDSALATALETRPDVILLNVPTMGSDGFSTLELLREHPETESVPVVVVTGMSPLEGEQTATKLGAVHYLTKPFELETLELAIKSALRESRPVSTDSIIRTGNKLIPLEKLIDGGVGLETFTIIEGAASTGKSAICQHFVYGALLERRKVAYFTHEYTPQSLAARMSSLGLEVPRSLRDTNLHVIQLPEFNADSDFIDLMANLTRDIAFLPSSIKLVVLDAITSLTMRSEDNVTLGFLYALKLLCRQGKTLIITVDSYAFGSNLMERIHALTDNHIHLNSIKMADRAIKTLEVLKTNKVELTEDNALSFQVELSVGIRILPMARIKA